MDAVRFLEEAERMCTSIRCKDCPFKRVVEAEALDGILIPRHSDCKFPSQLLGLREFFEYSSVVEEVERWSKEHPRKTNAMKFIEIFGNIDEMKETIMKYENGWQRWLDEEYKEPKTD